MRALAPTGTLIEEGTARGLKCVAACHNGGSRLENNDN